MLFMKEKEGRGGAKEGCRKKGSREERVSGNGGVRKMEMDVHMEEAVIDDLDNEEDDDVVGNAMKD